MNNTELKRHLKRKLERVTLLKLSLEGTVRELASEIISLNEELALVEGGKSSIKLKETVDISDYTSKFYAELEKARQNSDL
ncbi:hypothetical protein [Capnocytophaga granulosa]|uniref:hypothetical protein n=1 Tax=Capnocytophaga granulosa TaxID=45242 RepID=UPI00206110D8|nr:hypothetical protein [Capnocytophaga granulosa]DAY22113.1 MAG TPA: hypothetical protein [Caudoviricetes sp.]